ncbi:MAG TPA: hypothetical protein ENJ68_01960 [Devosia sp.]|nr:hypothetical protein [Devosia sp.]
MLRISGIALALAMMAGSAQATTIGIVCGGTAHLVVAPSVEKAEQCAAALGSSCTEGFRMDAGFYAIARSSNGALGVAAGSADLASARQTAISSCESQGGAGTCSISVSGNDDGTALNECQ